MGWKDWPHWLKGGVIVAVLYAILFLIYLLVAYSAEGNSQVGGGAGFGLALIPLVLSGIPATFLLSLLPNSADKSAGVIILLLFVVCVAQWFVIGIILGWIYGKIKNRNQQKT